LILGFYTAEWWIPAKKVPDLNCGVGDLLLEVVYLKQEVPDLRSGGTPHNFTPADDEVAVIAGVHVQVVSKPNDSVIYKSYTGKLSTTMEARRSRLECMHKSYTGKLSTTMEARRSRLERMQTLPNIKLISPTSSPSRSILGSTPEVPSDNPPPSPSPAQRSRRLGGKTTSSLVKRMSEGRFFLTDRSPARAASSPVFRCLPQPLPAAAEDAEQVEPLKGTATVQRGDGGDELRRDELKELDKADGDEAATASGDGEEDRSVEDAPRSDAEAPTQAATRRPRPLETAKKTARCRTRSEVTPKHRPSTRLPHATTC